MKKYFVLSDIHSFYNEMIEALDSKGFDISNNDHCVVICGDLFDRGPDAIKVFKFVKKLNDIDRLIYIRGNHEDLLFDCVTEIVQGRGISAHHYHNHTVDTICQFTGINKYDLEFNRYDKDAFDKKLGKLIKFIHLCAVDYAEIGDYICVHGWVPVYQGLDNFRDATDDDWRRARWNNGMAMWRNLNCRIPHKTIVCGHYHASWGHSHLHQDRKEFPQKNRINWKKSFEPFIDEGIIALDACTAYSGFCNCLIIEI